jgi:hypothetical protein
MIIFSVPNINNLFVDYVRVRAVFKDMFYNADELVHKEIYS